MLKVGFIGNGGIAKAAQKALDEASHLNVRTVGTLVRSGSDCKSGTFEDIDALLEQSPHLIVECASHSAIAAYGERILSAGVSLMVVSIGALCDDSLHERLNGAAQQSGAQLVLVSGAVGGLDALRAARRGGLTKVTYRARKPSSSWEASTGELEVDLATLDKPTVIFAGSAREAARMFPKNANVAASVALAGLGLDETDVELIADPQASQNTHEISFSGADGDFNFRMCGNPSPDNPKTSMLTAHSVAQAIVEFGDFT